MNTHKKTAVFRQRFFFRVLCPPVFFGFPLLGFAQNGRIRTMSELRAKKKARSGGARIGQTKKPVQICFDCQKKPVFGINQFF